MSAALTTDRLSLRPPTPADEGAFVAYYASDFRAQHGYPLNAPSIRLAERLGAVADPAAPYPASIGPHVPYRHDLTGGPAR